MGNCMLKLYRYQNIHESHEPGEIEILPYNDDEEIRVDQQSKSDDNLREMNIAKGVTLSLHLKRKIIKSDSSRDQIFPLLVSLHVKDKKLSYRPPIDLVCVIDHSASMEGEKIELVKNTFNYLLKYLSDSDRLSIVIFDDKVSRLFPLILTTQENKKKILYDLRDVDAGGDTDINLGMFHALKILKERRYTNTLSSIFLLSDGKDDGAQYKVKQTLDEFETPNYITIHTFGFGKDHDPQLMSDIANYRNGNFYFIEKLDTVDEAFVDCLGGLFSSVAQDAKISIRPEKSRTLLDVEIVKFYGNPSMWKFENGAYVIEMSNLISGSHKDFLLDLKIPPNKRELQSHEKSVKVASAEAEINCLSGKKIQIYDEMWITLLNETEDCQEDGEEDDKEVMKNFYRLKGASLMNEARKLADKGKNEQGKKLLESFKSELEGSVLKEEQFIKNLIQDIQTAIQSMDSIIYLNVGRINIIANSMSLLHQSSSIACGNAYQNKTQRKMVNEVKEMKSGRQVF